jgi:Rab guanine nucleotide exchange factor SEC2
VIEKVWEEASDSYFWSDAAGKPPVPPRKRGLWGMASAFGERAASWSEGDKEKRRASTSDNEVERKLPSPPPIHPVNGPPPRRRLPPPLPPQLPPPLPKRAEGRGRTRSATVSRATSPSPEPKAAEEDPAPIANDHMSTDDAGHSSTEEAEEDVPSPQAEMNNEAPEKKSEAHTEPVPEGEQSDADKTVSVPDVTSPLPSPTTDKRKSQDSFTSAASEITPSEAASASDSVHPAAEEAVAPPPASPKVPAVILPPTPTQVNPSAFTEAPSVPALHSDITKDVPLRTGSPAPPPLPRRAAARARPSSFIPPAPPTALAPENVPEIAGSEPKDTSPTLVVPEAIKEVTADPHTVPENSSEGNGEVAEEPITYNTVNEKDQADTKSLSAPSSFDDKSSSGPSSPTGTIVGNHINGNITESNVATPSQTAEGADGEAYVGDVTWEERVWKELVKLREDMFWARIGALR